MYMLKTCEYLFIDVLLHKWPMNGASFFNFVTISTNRTVI